VYTLTIFDQLLSIQNAMLSNLIVCMLLATVSAKANDVMDVFF